VAIKTDFWVNGRFIKELGPLDRSKEIFFSFGKPIEINGNGKEEHKQVIDFIKTRFDQWSKK
jgi:1-acyl-sn-glycerol-3-phosphate acyltransferase